MTRLIDEEEAFRVLSDYYKHRLYEQDIALIDALSRVPTAQSKRGHWIETEENHGFDDEVHEKALACSECNVAFKKSDYVVEDFRYCPNCGSRMDKE